MASGQILDQPGPGDFVRFSRDFGQRFILTVDTEEEFDWSKPLDRSDHTVQTVPRLRKFQQFCESAGVVPIYLVDHPVASSPIAAEVLGEALKSGKAEIGIQLHPWVSPPHEEEVSEYNSFSGNLPPALERAKLIGLRDTIEANFGIKPLIYRAGRYGVGKSSAGFLREAGVAVDTSVRSCFDYSSGGGPNFRDLPVRPWWIDQPGGLMEMPLTTVYWGILRQLGPWLYPMLWRVPRLRGGLAKAGLLERIPLTPEGVTIEEAIRGIDIALDEGLPLLVFSFHSPSLAPGFTPYVRSEDDLDAFYDWWRAVLGYLQLRKVAPASLRQVMEAVELA